MVNIYLIMCSSAVRYYDICRSAIEKCLPYDIILYCLYRNFNVWAVVSSANVTAATPLLCGSNLRHLQDFFIHALTDKINAHGTHVYLTAKK